MELTKKLALTILVFFSLTFSLISLGKWAFNDADEGIYAEVYYESVQRNNFLNFTYLKTPWAEKPPLLFWLMRGSALVFGENEFSLRLPSAILSAASVVLVFLIVLVATNNLVASFLSGLVLLTTAYFWFTGRQVRMDVPVTASILLCFYSFLKARKHSKWFLVFGFGLACGVLFKSVIGLLIYPVILIYSWFYKDWSWLKNKWFWLGNLLALVLTAPWHIYESIIYGQKFWHSYLVLHVVDRALTTVTSGPVAPFFYYFNQILITNQPWFLIIGISFLVYLYRRGVKNRKFELFLMVCSFFILVLFYVPKTRLLYYFTPMLPFMAMFIGSVTTRLIERRKNLVIACFAVVASVGLINTTLRIFSQKDRGFFLEDTKKISRTVVAEDERKVIQIASEKNLDLYLYNWNFYATLSYYATIHNDVKLKIYKNDVKMDPPCLLLIPTPLVEKIQIQTAHKILFRGEAATLVEIFSAQKLF